MKNSVDQGGCYPPRPKAEVDCLTLKGANELFVFPLSKNNTISFSDSVT